MGWKEGERKGRGATWERGSGGGGGGGGGEKREGKLKGGEGREEAEGGGERGK